jgi:hypothetical protein
MVVHAAVMLITPLAAQLVWCGLVAYRVSTCPDEEDGVMHGFDDIEIEVDGTPVADFQEQKRKAAAALTKLENGGTLALAAATTSSPANDCDPTWPLYAHPEAFPNGTGLCPTGMKFERWPEILMERQPSVYQRNPIFVLDMLNIVLRHKVNTAAYIQMKDSPQTLQNMRTSATSACSMCMQWPTLSAAICAGTGCSSCWPGNLLLSAV